jgi:hypothetical protein
MKILSKKFRETATDFYGKRGMSLHGAALIFDAQTGTGRRTEFFDDVLDDSTQDYWCVFIAITALLRRIERQYPALKTITIQSDGAGCYKNGYLLSLIHWLNSANVTSIKVRRYVYSESGAGTHTYWCRAELN